MKFLNFIFRSKVRDVVNGSGSSQLNSASVAKEKFLDLALSGTLTRTSDWLKFAEAKNAALLTFSSAWLIAIGNLCFGSNRPHHEVVTALAVAALFVIASAFLSLYALLPKISLRPGNTRKSHRNLLYYGEIEGHDGEWLIKEMKSVYFKDHFEAVPDRYSLDLADQIADLSRVATRKFRLFAYGAGSMGCALASFVLTLTAQRLFNVIVELINRC